jgi:hypothetical protein
MMPTISGGISSLTDEMTEALSEWYEGHMSYWKVIQGWRDDDTAHAVIATERGIDCVSLIRLGGREFHISIDAVIDLTDSTRRPVKWE